MVHTLYAEPEHDYFVDVDPIDGDISKIEVVDQTPDGWLPFIHRIQPAFTMGRRVN